MAEDFIVQLSDLLVRGGSPSLLLEKPPAGLSEALRQAEGGRLLQLACERNPACARRLLELGARPRAAGDAWCFQALLQGAGRPGTEAARLALLDDLLARGGDPNARLDLELSPARRKALGVRPGEAVLGDTPLMTCCRLRTPETGRLLARLLEEEGLALDLEGVLLPGPRLGALPAEDYALLRGGPELAERIGRARARRAAERKA